MYTKPVFKLYKLTVEIPAATKFFFGLFSRKPELKEFYFKSEQDAVNYHGELFPDTVLKVERFRAITEGDRWQLLQKYSGKLLESYVFSDVVNTVINTNRRTELAIAVAPRHKREWLHRVTLEEVGTPADMQFFICAQPDCHPNAMSKHSFYKATSKIVEVTASVNKTMDSGSDSDSEIPANQLHLR